MRGGLGPPLFFFTATGRLPAPLAEVLGDETAQLVLCQTAAADPVAPMFHERAWLTSQGPGFLTTRVRVTAHRTRRAGGDRFHGYTLSGQGVCSWAGEFRALHRNQAVSAHSANGLAVELTTCYIPSPLTPLGILAGPAGRSASGAHLFPGSGRHRAPAPLPVGTASK